MLLRALHLLPPERAHNLGLWALKSGMLPAKKPVNDARLIHSVCGLEFKNPVGLAAGFDKNAVAIEGLFTQGFGFVEVGTVTPKPQAGNPQPRIFRLAKARAVINRLGFNNQGLERYVANIQHHKKRGIVGANIGKNKDSDHAHADYVTGLQAVYAHADYITVNISSPNTPGLRDLQHGDALNALLSAVLASRDAAAQQHGKTLPIWLKVAPDLDAAQKEDIARLVMLHQIDALIVSNTTISRPDSLTDTNKDEQGGLSGAPLLGLSTEALREFYTLTQGNIPLIGVGGIGGAADAYAKIKAGASLVQLYTALVYQGFDVVRDINIGLLELLERDGYTHMSQAIGADHS